MFRRISLLCAALLVPLAIGVSGASAEVLYDQTGGPAAGGVPSMKWGNPSPPVDPASSAPQCDGAQTESSCFAADDFTVPAGPTWIVTNVHVASSGGAGDKIEWQMQAATSQAPSTGEYDAPFAEPIATGGSIYSPWDAVATPDGYDLTLPVDGPAVLMPGHYWLSVFADQEEKGPLGSPFLWQSVSAVSGSPAVWSSPACSAPPAYLPLAQCGQPGSDLSFRIEGEKLTSSYSRLRIGKRERTPDGGSNILATISGLPSLNGLTIKKVSGRAHVTFLKTLCESKHDPNESRRCGFRVRPVGKTARALKQGKKFKIKLLASFTRVLYTSNPAVTSPTATRVVNLVLKKVR